MFARSQKALCIALSLLAAMVVSTSSLSAQGTPTFTDVTVHDPSVVRDGATYYVFGSHLASASTTDLMGWRQITSDWNAVTNPTCSLILNNSPATEFAAALSYTVPPDFWGPDVRKLGDGRYYLYYCVCNNTSRAALGLAVANAITGPYANVGIMLESGMAGLSPDGTVYNNAVHPNVVDPSVFFDNAGKLWMVYGSYSGGIFILSLDPATGQPFAGLAYGKKLIGGNNCRIEGPFILYSPESAYYYMFFTFGGFDVSGGYNIRVGRSRNPDGPYLDAAGNDLTNVEGAPNTVFDDASIAPYGVKLMGNYQFLHVASEPLTTSVGYISPGGTSAYYDNATGKYLMVFHTRFAGLGQTHHVRVHQMFLNADGWPVVAPQRYAQETMSTTVASQIPGDYKLINHGKDITATVKTSSIITLNADGSLTGAASGAWQLSGDHYATLTLAGTSYHGVFVRLWDDDNQVWTLTFSAISPDGVAIWGTKVTVAAAPVFLTHPVSQTVVVGASVILTAAASGEPAPTYQWKKDGATLGGAIGNSYLIASATANDAGSYTVVATNTVSSTTSNPAILTVSAVNIAPVITLPPVSQTVWAGSSVTFTAAVSGTPTPALQWKKDGVDINGATNSAFTITRTVTADAGSYTMVASNIAGSATSNAATLTVINPAATGDFNGDGKADLLWSNSLTGERALWLMNGTQFLGSSTLGIFPLEWTVAATGDFNGDGKTDIVWSNSITGERAIWLMNGTQFLASSTLGVFPLEWTIAATGDFNGDGKPDIVWSNSITGERVIWLMNGTNFLASSTLGIFPLEWTVAATGDFNGDGKPDIIWSNSLTGERAIWLMNGTQFLGASTLGVFPLEWTVAGTADFNNDGKPDIIWSNSITGERALWLMNGTNFLSSSTLGIFPLEWTVKN